MLNKKNYLTPKEVAERLMVSTATIRLWVKSGQLKSHYTLGGHRRFINAEVEQFERFNKIKTTQPQTKILIVDDEIAFAEFLQTLLNIEFKDIIIKISLDGFDAANKLRDFSPDIVLLDLKIPGLDGFEVCKHIKQTPLLKHIRVIAITGDLSQLKQKQIMDNGAEACFEKPINSTVLFKQLNLTFTDVKAKKK